ncbi:MAG: hypothetical protein FJ279_22060, partial [Planctomycetes bacterium]|nr:hypothetical protein [Planctomycetota bacterium]
MQSQIENRKSQILLCGLALAFLLPGAAWAQATVKAERDVYTLENPHFKVVVDSAAGGRIRSWTLKPSGRELIALWKGGGEVGGALDDRAFFTAMRYDASVAQPGTETATLRLEAKHLSGLGVVKYLTARRDSPTLEVHWQFSNGSQSPQRLFIRNFFLPGTKPQTDEHLYWVNGTPERGGKAVEGTGEAHGYYLMGPGFGAPTDNSTPTDKAKAGVPSVGDRRSAPLEFAALWDKGTGDGLLAFAPGVGKFYFWRGSKEFPTFEWIYADVPPGKALSASVALVVVHGQTATPDWKALATAHSKGIRKASITPLQGWVDEATKFSVSDAERQRGFWLSIGADDGKQRLPEQVPLDLPQDDDRYVAVALNVLKDFEATVRVDVPQAWQQQIEVFWETPG